jgi:hypothetical protein
MGINFADWVHLEMAVVARQSLSIDEDDIAYLKQFPSRKWAQALYLRYGELLFSAISGDGKLKSSWRRPRVIPILGMDVEINMGYVYRKLVSAGYDFSGINAVNKIIPYYNIPTLDSWYRIVKNLRAESDDPNNPEPDVVYFSPNAKMASRNDPEPTEKDTMKKREDFERIWPRMEDEIRRQLENSKLSGYMYLNAIHWRQPDQFLALVKRIKEYTWLNWNNLKYSLDNSTNLYGYINKQIINILQNGLIGRGAYTSALKRGEDLYAKYITPHPETGKSWTIDQMRAARNSAVPSTGTFG